MDIAEVAAREYLPSSFKDTMSGEKAILKLADIIKKHHKPFNNDKRHAFVCRCGAVTFELFSYRGFDICATCSLCGLQNLVFHA